MPKKEINYSKTIFYRLVCNDINILDCYIGHTTNFIKRKQLHKCNCNNENSKGYNYNVYIFIRENGGWDNWTMVMINEINCKDLLDAHRQERQYIEEYKAHLNKVIPTRTMKDWIAENKELIQEKKQQYYITNKEYIQLTRSKKICCDYCNCEFRLSDKVKHFKTQKHINNILKIKV